ncbi:hypothetical protein GCM10026982_50570 [Nocardiopsis aegyptia]
MTAGAGPGNIENVARSPRSGGNRRQATVPLGYGTVAAVFHVKHPTPALTLRAVRGSPGQAEREQHDSGQGRGELDQRGTQLGR